MTVRLIDSSILVDVIRPKTPTVIKRFIASEVMGSDVYTAEPVIFEVLRHAKADQLASIWAQLLAVPVLRTPRNLWEAAAELGRSCRRHGANAGALDLLIASVAIHHGAELVSFDTDFQRIALASNLRVKVLPRPRA
jgi:predicted nucleic acid-binding protein